MYMVLFICALLMVNRSGPQYQRRIGKFERWLLLPQAALRGWTEMEFM